MTSRDDGKPRWAESNRGRNHMTDYAKYSFTVKEDGRGGTPFIGWEPRIEPLPALADVFISFELRPGTTLDEARAVADYLDEHIVAVGYTQLPTRDDSRL